MPWWPSGLERYTTAREVCGSNPALGILFAPIERLFYQFAKLLSLREIRGCFYLFATKRRWISRGGSLFKIINDCIDIADKKRLLNKIKEHLLVMPTFKKNIIFGVNLTYLICLHTHLGIIQNQFVWFRLSN